MKEQTDRMDVPGFGFPVTLMNAPMTEVWGEQEIDLDERQLNTLVVRALLEATFRWTGAQVRYVRHGMDMTQRQLATELGLSSHAAVVKWEKAGEAPTGMCAANEIILRQVALEHFSCDPMLAGVRRLPFQQIRPRVLAAKEEERPVVAVDARDVELSVRFPPRQTESTGRRPHRAFMLDVDKAYLEVPSQMDRLVQAPTEGSPAVSGGTFANAA